MNTSKRSALSAIFFNTMTPIRRYQPTDLEQEFKVKRRPPIVWHLMAIFLIQSATVSMKLLIATRTALTSFSYTDLQTFQTSFRWRTIDVRLRKFQLTTRATRSCWSSLTVLSVTSRKQSTKSLEVRTFPFRLWSWALEKLTSAPWTSSMPTKSLSILRSTRGTWAEISFNSFHLVSSEEMLSN